MIVGERYAMTRRRPTSDRRGRSPCALGARDGRVRRADRDRRPATLRKKLGLESDRYLILGACSPTFAHQALELEPELGVLLPCNVVVYERGGATFVSAVDAERMLSIVDNDDLTPVAEAVRGRLARVVERVARPEA